MKNKTCIYLCCPFDVILGRLCEFLGPTQQPNTTAAFFIKKNASSFPDKYRFLFLSPIKNLLLPLFFLLHAIRAQIWSVLLLLFFLIKWWLIGVSIFFTGDDGYCGMVSLLLRRWFRTTGYVYSSPLFLILWFDLVFLDWFPESMYEKRFFLPK